MQTNQPSSAGADTTSSESGDPREKAQALAGQAQEKAQDMAGKAQASAQAAVGQVQGSLREQLDRRSAQAAERIKSQASDLRVVGNSLREHGQAGPAQAAERVAQYAERIGGYLRDKDSDALLSDAEDFARRQPWAVAAGGLVLGFAASRFLKASGRKRYSARSEGPPSATLPQRSNVPALPARQGPRSPQVPPTVAGEPVVGFGPHLPARPPAQLPPDAPSAPAASSSPGAEPWRR
jgi:hypothetical protein